MHRTVSFEYAHEIVHVVNAVGTEVYLTVQMEWYFVRRLLLGAPRAAFDRYCERLGAVLAGTAG